MFLGYVAAVPSHIVAKICPYTRAEECPEMDAKVTLSL